MFNFAQKLGVPLLTRAKQTGIIPVTFGLSHGAPLTLGYPQAYWNSPYFNLWATCDKAKFTETFLHHIRLTSHWSNWIILLWMLTEVECVSEQNVLAV
jgi:hypothetical protein